MKLTDNGFISGLPDFVMLIGIPGSGKSTLSRNFRLNGYKVLSSDEIRLGISGVSSFECLGKRERSELNKRVFEQIAKQARDALSAGISVVVDATNLNRKKRMSFLRGLGGISCIRRCFLFVTSVDVCKRRNSARGELSRVPDRDFHRMLCSFESPCFAEGWEDIVLIEDEEPYSFPFEQSRDFKQDNPHHELTLLEHLEAASRYARDAGYSEKIIRTAYYHDIGKLYTKTFESYNGEPSEIAHYYGHENYGAYLYLCEKCCGSNMPEDIFHSYLYEANLINFHNRPLTAWRSSEAALKRDREIFGNEFINDVLALNAADVATHKE